jgi:hypothetical protein
MIFFLIFHMKFSFGSLQTDLVLLLLFSRYKGVENGSITQNFFILILMGIFLLRFFIESEQILI